MASVVNDQVSATFNYVDRASLEMWDRRFDFDPQWSGIPVAPKRMIVTDAAMLADAPRFDREGFQCVRLPCGTVDPRDGAALEHEWKPALLAAVQELTGADAAVGWGLSARFSERDGGAPRSEVSNPARRVHPDFSPSEFADGISHQPALDAIAALGEGRRPRRWLGINVWQSMNPPPYDTPLALCDARSVAPRDLVIGRGSAPSLRGLELDLPLYAPSVDHSWYYWSRFQPGEALVFSGLDSDRPGDWRLVPHSAFDRADCPSDAPARASAEIRCLALFY